MTEKLSRRDFLKLGTVGVLGGLAACSPAATEALRPPPTQIVPTAPAGPAGSSSSSALSGGAGLKELIDNIAARASQYLSTLDDSRRARTSYAFTDPELTRWHWTTPGNFPRNGLALRDMEASQRDAALALLQASESAYGLQKSLDIISLQNDLGNDPTLYYVTIFGTPGVEPWGWRWEGHHLSRRYNVINGRLSVTPFFLGAWPTVNNAGLKAMEREEWAARELINSLDDTTRAAVIFQQDAPGIHFTQNQAYVAPLETIGVPAHALTMDGQALIREIIHKYLDTLPDLIAAAHLGRLESAGFENIHFAWAGSLEPQRAHYYRLQGPTFLMEHDNSRNRATHIHSVWRDFAEDFGNSF